MIREKLQKQALDLWSVFVVTNTTKHLKQTPNY